jgi:hypothetical protein
MNNTPITPEEFEQTVSGLSEQFADEPEQLRAWLFVLMSNTLNRQGYSQKEITDLTIKHGWGDPDRILSQYTRNKETKGHNAQLHFVPANKGFDVRCMRCSETLVVLPWFEPFFLPKSAYDRNLAWESQRVCQNQAESLSVKVNVKDGVGAEDVVGRRK